MTNEQKFVEDQANKSKMKLDDLQASFEEGKPADVGTIPAPNGVYEVKEGKVSGTVSRLKEFIGERFYVNKKAAKDGTYTVESSHIKKYTKPNGGLAMVTLSLDEKRKLREEWDRSWKANEHTEIKREDPTKYALMFQAKYGRMPNL